MTHPRTHGTAREGAGEQRTRPGGTVTTPRSTQRSRRQPRPEVTPCVPSPVPTGDPIAPRGYAVRTPHVAGRRPWSTTTDAEDHAPTPCQGGRYTTHESRPGEAHIPPLYPFFALSTQLFPTPGRTGKRRRRAERLRRINTMVRSRPFDVTSAPGQDGVAWSLPHRLPPGGESRCPWRVVSEVRS